MKPQPIICIRCRSVMKPIDSIGPEGRKKQLVCRCGNAPYPTTQAQVNVQRKAA
jgi:hypothetical protein